ncbi:MAG: iron-containing alcohol dehydrogenase [Planctomycetia bacterium]|nr:iron-containing alcohol dehydrogenase [Planctomycetia bacterium]
MTAVLSAFDFHPATRVVFGPGALERLGDLVREYGGARVLLVTDPGLKAVGHPLRARDILMRAGCEVYLYDAVEENPTTKHVGHCLEFARQHVINFIVAVGGGSAMDCAKGVNFLLTNGGKMSDYKGFGLAKKPMLPSVGVPTSSGTGSEAQSYALIADEKTHLKMACGDRKAAFVAAILDPELTVSLPPGVTAISGIDAITHAVESYVSLRRSLLSQALSREAWQLLAGSFERVLSTPSDVVARGQMQLGANLAGMAIENSMLGAAHATANPLTAHYGITHGVAVGIMIQHVIRFNSVIVGSLYANLAQDVGLRLDPNGDPGETLALRINTYLHAAGLPTRLRDCGVSSGIFEVLADEACHQWTGKFNPRPVGEAEFISLYRSAY